MEFVGDDYQLPARARAALQRTTSYHSDYEKRKIIAIKEGVNLFKAYIL